MKGFSIRWKDFPDYIISITKDIWKDRGVGTLHHYYAKDIVVASPMGIQRGNQQVIAATMVTINEFPDHQPFADDVIWSEHETGYLSSHRLNTVATHTRYGAFGAATGKRWNVMVIADGAALEDTIFDEWLVRDYGGMVRQLGSTPETYAAQLIAFEGGAGSAKHPFTPDQDLDVGYHGRGNDNPWGQRYADSLSQIMDVDFAHIRQNYDRAMVGEYAGAVTSVSAEECTKFWISLRSAFPSATFKIHHQIGMDGGMMPPRSALRWSLDGLHDGWGSFGAPTGAPVHIMGMSHAEFGPYGPDGVGLRREYALIDEVAICKQILMQKG